MATACRARAGALARGGRPLRPAPADPRGGPARAAPPQGGAGARRRRRRTRLPGPALPGRGGRGHHRRGRRRRGGDLQPAASGGPRRGRRRARQDRLRGGHPGRGQPAGHGRAPRPAAGLGQRAGAHRRLRPGARRHRQLRHPLPGQRRLRAARQAARVGLDLPLRRPGQRLVGRARPVLPLCLPRAAAAGHGAVLRRGRRAGRALRGDRVGADHRDDQAADRGGRAAGRAADGARRAAAELGHADRAQGPRLRRVRDVADGDRAGGLRGVLRGGRGRRPGAHRHGHRARRGARR